MIGVAYGELYLTLTVWRLRPTESSLRQAQRNGHRPFTHNPWRTIGVGSVFNENRTDTNCFSDMFLGDLARTKARYPFALFGYCLMSNHFHLLLKPAPGQSISRILQSLTVAHTWRHHRRQGTSGHVWQSRFRPPIVQDGDHLLVVLRYIEANPVRAAMVADPCEYTWSSPAAMAPGMPIPSWTRSRNGSNSVVLSRNVGPADDGRSVGNKRPRSWMACGRRCAVAGPTVQRTGSRSFPIASASSVSRAVVVVRHAKRCSDTGIPPLAAGIAGRVAAGAGWPGRMEILRFRCWAWICHLGWDRAGNQRQYRASGERHQGPLFPCLDPPGSRKSCFLLCLLPQEHSACIDRLPRLDPAPRFDGWMIALALVRQRPLSFSNAHWQQSYISIKN